MPSSAGENIYAVLSDGSLALLHVQESVCGTKEIFLSCLEKVSKNGLDGSIMSSKTNFDPFKRKKN